MYVKVHFGLISKDVWLEARVEGTEWYTWRWLRAVLPVNWPEAAGFVGTQMLPMFPNGQMGPWPGKTQHHSRVMDLERQTRVLLKNNSDLCIFQIHSLAT